MAIAERERTETKEPSLSIPKLEDLEQVIDPSIVNNFSRFLRYEDLAPGSSTGIYVGEASIDSHDLSLIFVQRAQMVVTKGKVGQRTYWRYNFYRGKLPIPEVNNQEFEKIISKAKRSTIVPADKLNDMVLRDLQAFAQKAG